MTLTNLAVVFRQSATWTAPADVQEFNGTPNTLTRVLATGAGGGSSTKGGGGGGSGFTNEVPVTPGSIYNIVVGVAGTRGVNGVTPGGAGDSSFFDDGTTSGFGGTAGTLTTSGTGGNGTGDTDFDVGGNGDLGGAGGAGLDANGGDAVGSTGGIGGNAVDAGINQYKIHGHIGGSGGNAGASGQPGSDATGVGSAGGAGGSAGQNAGLSQNGQVLLLYASATLPGADFTLVQTIADIGGGVSVKEYLYSPAVAPTITSNGAGSTASVSVAENQTAVTTVVATGDATISYSKTGGADQAKFSINSSTGVLTFASAPDFENPTDANTDNAYIVAVTATNATGTDVQTITVTVTNVAEGGSPTPHPTSIGIGVGI